MIRIGPRRLPAAGGAVIAINHTSYLAFAYVAMSTIKDDKRHIQFMGKIELRKNPILRWLMWGCGVILVEKTAAIRSGGPKNPGHT